MGDAGAGAGGDMNALSGFTQEEEQALAISTAGERRVSRLLLLRGAVS